jgi:predicted ATP-dependent endonuclease of OLD family
MKDSIKIIQLTSENIKRIRAVTITPDGNLVVIGGDNANGKTSVLDSIAMALGGGKMIPDQPVRRGQKHGRVEIDLGDLIVERRFTSKGSTLMVMPKDGREPFKSPQGVLDKLVGKLSFDPLEFVTMKPDAQLKTLKDLVGLDLSDLEQRRRSLYEDRSLANAEVKTLEGQLESLREHKDAPSEPVSVESLLTEIDDAEIHNSNGAALQLSLKSNEDAVKRCEDEIARLRARAMELKAEQAIWETNAADVRLRLAMFEPRDTESLKEQIKTAGEQNRKIQENELRKRLVTAMRKKSAESLNLTNKIEDVDAEKEQRLSEAEFPVPGLSFGEDGVLLNGLPFDQASSAEQLKVSIAMGIAMNPKLKVLLIRDGSLLDENSLAMVAKMADEHDMQIWLEKVGQDDSCSVIIEDGMIQEKEEQHAAV